MTTIVAPSLSPRQARANVTLYLQRIVPGMRCSPGNATTFTSSPLFWTVHASSGLRATTHGPVATFRYELPSSGQASLVRHARSKTNAVSPATGSILADQWLRPAIPTRRAARRPGAISSILRLCSGGLVGQASLAVPSTDSSSGSMCPSVSTTDIRCPYRSPRRHISIRRMRPSWLASRVAIAKMSCDNGACQAPPMNALKQQRTMNPGG